MSKTAEDVRKFKEICAQYGWSYEVRRRSILTITKKIVPGDNESFCHADMEYGIIFGYAKSTSAGSVWGTDGGGIGAISAMNSGYFVMNKSGVSVRFLNALSKG